MRRPTWAIWGLILGALLATSGCNADSTRVVDHPPHLLFNTACAHYWAGDHEAAEAGFRRVASLSRDPGLKARALFNLGQCAVLQAMKGDQQDPESAIRILAKGLSYFREAWDLDPSLLEAARSIEGAMIRLQGMRERAAREAPREAPRKDERGASAAEGERQDQRPAGGSAAGERQEEPSGTSVGKEPDPNAPPRHRAREPQGAVEGKTKRFQGILSLEDQRAYRQRARLSRVEPVEKDW